MFINEFDHSPFSDLDYGFDWTAWLQTGETISSSSWEADSGVTLTNAQVDGFITSTFAQVDTKGVLYSVKNTITTSYNRVDSRTLILSCKQL